MQTIKNQSKYITTASFSTINTIYTFIHIPNWSILFYTDTSLFTKLI